MTSLKLMDQQLFGAYQEDITFLGGGRLSTGPLSYGLIQRLKA